MARLREPDEVKNRRTKKEPTSWQVRQTQGLPNTKLDRDKLKFDREKVALAQKNKEDDRAQKASQHQEKRQDAWAAREETLRHKEATDTQKSTDLRIKEQKKQNINHFKNHLFEKHGEIIDDKGTRGIPLDIEKRASRYMTELESGSLTGPDAVKKFRDDYAQEEGVKKQYAAIRPQVIKEAEALKGSALNPEEIASLDKAPPERMAATVSSFQEKQVAVKAKADAELGAAGEKLTSSYPDPNIAGGKPRYMAEDMGKGSFGGLPVRPDLSFGESREAYNDLVDRAVAAQGGGFIPTAAGLINKNLPGARDILDPNTPLRTGIRKAGEAIAGVFQGREGQMGPPAPTAPTSPVSAADLIPTFGDGSPTPPVAPAAAPAVGTPPSLTSVQLQALANKPQASWTPEEVAAAGPNLQASIAKATLSEMGTTGKAALSTALAAGKDLFTASPEEMERRTPFLRGDATQPPTPVGATTPARTMTPATAAANALAMAEGGDVGAPKPVSTTDPIPTFGDRPATPPLTPTAPTSLDVAPVPGPTAVAPVPPPEAPGAVPPPVSVGTVPAPVAAVPPPAEPGAIAPMQKPGNIFSGLADTVKGIFTASSENAESAQNVWKSLPQTQEPVTSSPAIKRPDDEENRAFPKAM